MNQPLTGQRIYEINTQKRSDDQPERPGKMTLQDAIQQACAIVGINVPRNCRPGVWAKSSVIGKPASNTSGRVMVFEDQRGGIAHNWASGLQEIFRVEGASTSRAAPARIDNGRAERERQERAAVAEICAVIVRNCRHDLHPYFAAKGFPTEMGLVHDNPRQCIPPGDLGDAIARAMPVTDEPLLIVPGWIGRELTTLQFITVTGDKKNILRGAMSGASYRIASGTRTFVCEGIATAMTVRAALRLLGIPATVLSAFAAANVAKVGAASGGFICADNDRPLPQLHDKGTGEFYAAGSGCKWAMPPEPGDWNDYHAKHGLRAVALALREVLQG